MSDTLSLVSNPDGSAITAVFVSDVEGIPLVPLANAATIIEDGTIQTAATIALIGNSAGEHFFVEFQSDVDSTTTPEPATLALLGVGLAGLAASRRGKLTISRLPAAKGSFPLVADAQAIHVEDRSWPISDRPPIGFSERRVTNHFR